jgi:glycosyltransferase involved in cell wall biosynthesis
MRLALLASHPIQYQAPWFRELARRCELRVFFAHRPDPTAQGEGFGTAFAWDVDLLSGYEHEFLPNRAKAPGTSHFRGCDTPTIHERLGAGGFDALILTGWHLRCYWQGQRAAKALALPVFVRGDSQLGTPRPLWKRLGKELAYRLMLRRFDGFLCVGQRNHDYLRHYGVPEAKLHRVPHFVDNAWFRERAAAVDREATRRAWGLATGRPALLFVGKFIPKKRPLDLLEATERLPAARRPALVYVGSGELGPALRARAGELGVEALFPGFLNQSELPAAYAAADALVLPSESETWGLVVNEAMACGLPAIVSEACGCAPDLIEESVTGFAYPAGDVAALAEKIERLLALRESGHDWGPALEETLRGRDPSSCATMTLAALGFPR